MSPSTVTRRRIIVAAITFSGLTTGTIGISVLQLSETWAAGHHVDGDTLTAMTRLARLLYPHDAISDSVYAEVLDQALSVTAGANGSFANVLVEAEEVLNAQGDGDFIYLDEDTQIAVLRAVEDEPFFGEILGTVRFRLYNHPAVWQHIGYDGPSWQKGGYLNRGAGEIDWLPGAE